MNTRSLGDVLFYLIKKIQEMKLQGIVCLANDDLQWNTVFLKPLGETKIGSKNQGKIYSNFFCPGSKSRDFTVRP